MELEAAGKKLSNLAKINVLLGKNGSGKSTLLRSFDQNRNALPNAGEVRYITPERGGELSYQGNIETQMLQSPSWGADIRRRNRYENFRQMSVTEFRRLETLVLRKIEKDPATRQNAKFSFDNTVASINQLLDNVQLVRTTAAGFEIQAKDKGDKRAPDTLSSGEAELVSLAIEILAFAYSAEAEPSKCSFLFLDEPDVHLHPDLQQRLIKLLTDAVELRNITVVIATHSTAILGALSDHDEARIGFVTFGQNEVKFEPIGERLQRILPIFGAHPLSNVFNKTPILLVEGEDDERIWQQAIRSSQRSLVIWPCAAGDIQSLDDYENEVEAIAGAVYDNAKAFSLRDRDDAPYEIDDKTIVKRMRLFCRAAENLLLSDDVLKLLGLNWKQMHAAIEDWLSKYREHPQYDAMNAFKSAGYDRLGGEIKTLRNVFMMLAGSQKPWEVAVGQAIAALKSETPPTSEHCLRTYLGPKLVDALTLRPPAASVSRRINRYWAPRGRQ